MRDFELEKQLFFEFLESEIKKSTGDERYLKQLETSKESIQGTSEIKTEEQLKKLKGLKCLNLKILKELDQN
jgi:hypothetical protein